MPTIEQKQVLWIAREATRISKELNSHIEPTNLITNIPRHDVESLIGRIDCLAQQAVELAEKL